MIEVRPCQATAIESVISYATSRPSGSGSALVVGPPGVGKTLILATVGRILAAEQGMRGLYLAHRREIVDQHYETLIRCGIPENMLGVIMPNDHRINSSAPIQVASIDSLHRRGAPPADFVASDECHRDASLRRRALLQLYPHAFTLGATATPWRLDGQSLASLYDEMFVIATPSELIADGLLAAPKAFTVDTAALPDLTKVRTVGGDFDGRELAEAMDQPKLVGDVVVEWKKRAGNRRTVVFAVNIAHSKSIVERFLAAGIKAAHIDQTTSHTDREATLRAFKNGDVRVISNVNVLSEGWDCPECKCVVLVRPTKSLSMFIQQAGRCMRPWESVEPILLDHAGNIFNQKHYLPQLDRDWKLHAHRRREVAGVAPVKRCASCGAVVAAGLHACPECGLHFPRPDLTREAEGELTDVRNVTPPRTKIDWFMNILSVARTLVDLPDPPEVWAARVYTKKYHEPPPAEALLSAAS